MSKKTIRKIEMITLAFVLFLAFPRIAFADTDSDLSAAGDKIDELKDAQEQAQGELGNLEDYKSNLTGDLAELDSELAAISQKLDELADQIEDKNTEISEKQDSIEAIQATADQQYEDMKKRIQFMYENGNQSALSTLFSADSFSDFLNQTEYVIAIQDYDRDKLEEYKNTQRELTSEKEELQTAKNDLIAMQEEEQAQQASVNTLIAEKQAKISEAETQISQTQADIDSYTEQIAEQEAYEEELEKKKEQEEAARLAEIKKQEENDKKTEVVVAAGDQELLAALIDCEAGGESYEGKLAVGSVVLNRVASSHFPTTVVGVIYQSGQFSPVASGRFASVLGKGASASSQQAAAEILGGKRTLSCLYFRRNTGLIQGTVIGNHVFF